jgi:RNA polymerase sigma-54 factor
VTTLDYKTQTNNYSDDDENHDSPLSPPSFHQDLINQLNTFILDDGAVCAEFLVGIGRWVTTSQYSDIVDDMAFTQGIYTDERLLKKMLQVIHELEPSGVGARDLQECLMLQLKHKTPTSQ